MGKKKFPFLFKATETPITTTTTSAAPSWPWPSCINNPKTLSFRANTNENTSDFAETPRSFFTFCTSFEQHNEESFSCESDDHSAVIRGLRSDRLFFEPGQTSSILEEAKTASPYKSVAILAIESRDPFVDFRVSMEEMVEAHGIKDWDFLEELLACYLRVNGKSNHGYIVAAFVDLLIHLALIASSDSSGSDDITDENCFSASASTQYSFTSPLSFSSSTYSSTSHCLCSSTENEDEIIVKKNGDVSLLLSSCNASSPGV